MSIASPPPQPASLPLHRFSVAQYQQMAAAGVFADGERVELLEGWVVEKMNQNPPHSVCVKLCDALISAILPTGWHTRTQASIITADSQPEPDLVVVRGEIRDYVKQHPAPAEVALVIEVADSSLTRDHYKRTIYARARIAEYWIVDINARRVEVYGQPSGEQSQADYGERRVYVELEQIPVTIDGQQHGTIGVGELMP